MLTESGSRVKKSHLSSIVIDLSFKQAALPERRTENGSFREAKESNELRITLHAGKKGHYSIRYPAVSMPAPLPRLSQPHHCSSQTPNTWRCRHFGGAPPGLPTDDRRLADDCRRRSPSVTDAEQRPLIKTGRAETRQPRAATSGRGAPVACDAGLARNGPAVCLRVLITHSDTGGKPEATELMSGRAGRQ